ncbi:MAG: phenylacetate--CoA ligase family protein, partial [Pseudomonadota bacterium]
MDGAYDLLETRNPDERAAALADALPQQVAAAQSLSGYSAHLAGVDAAAITAITDLANVPVLRKAALIERQAADAPFGGLTTLEASGFERLFQSPGPIYEPGRVARDWWRLGRFLHAAGIGEDDVVQNCF